VGQGASGSAVGWGGEISRPSTEGRCRSGENRDGSCSGCPGSGDVPVSRCHSHHSREGRRRRPDGNEVAKAGRDRRQAPTMATNGRVRCPDDSSVPLVHDSSPPGGRWRSHEEDPEVGVARVGSDDSMMVALGMDGSRTALEWRKTAAKVGLRLMPEGSRRRSCSVLYRLHAQIWRLLAIGRKGGSDVVAPGRPNGERSV